MNSKLVYENYLNSFWKRLFGFFYLLLTRYSVQISTFGDIKASPILLLFVEERERRADCLRQCEALLEGFRSGGFSVTFVYAKRVFGVVGLLAKLQRFSYSNRKCSLNFWEFDVESLREQILDHQAVFAYCDSHPAENSIVQYFNEKGATTFSMQHGVYPTAGTYWKNVYASSNAKCFFCWDEHSRTEYQKYSLRNYFPAGPVIDMGITSFSPRIPSNLKKVCVHFSGPGEKDEIRFMSVLMEALHEIGLELYYTLHPSDKGREFQHAKRLASDCRDLLAPNLVNIFLRSTVGYKICQLDGNVIAADYYFHQFTDGPEADDVVFEEFIFNLRIERDLAKFWPHRTVFYEGAEAVAKIVNLIRAEATL